MNDILVLYYSRSGTTKKLANLIARGIESVEGASARIRTVADNNNVTNEPVVSHQDLQDCIGLALGSPVRFGSMAGPIKTFIESTSTEWLMGVLVGKPACVFTSSSSIHGGQESCLLSMMLPLLHHGMLLMSLPYTNTELMYSTTGGTPYGVSHVSGVDNNLPISMHEKSLAIAQGKNLALTALKLRS